MGSPLRAYSPFDNDAFVAKLDNSGGLLWNTFLGSSAHDEGCGIAVDDSGNVYVVGYSSATWGTPVRAYSSNYDAFIAKLTSNGSLTWNSFLGGTGDDFGLGGVALDTSGNPYVAGTAQRTGAHPCAHTHQGMTCLRLSSRKAAALPGTVSSGDRR